MSAQQGHSGGLDSARWAGRPGLTGRSGGPSLPHNAIVLQTRGKQDDKSAGWVVPTPSPDSQVPPPSPHGQVARAWRACPPGGLLLPGPGTRPSRSPSVRSEPSPPLPSSAVLRVLRINVRVFRRCLLRPASHQPVIITPRWLCLVPAPRRWRRGAKPWPRRRRGPLAVCGRSKRVFSQTARRWRPQRLPFFLTPHSVGSLGAAAPAGCVHLCSLPGSPCPRPRRRHSEAVAASAARGSATRRSTVRSPSGFSFVSGPSWGLGAKKPGAVVAPESWILAPHCSELRSDSG